MPTKQFAVEITLAQRDAAAKLSEAVLDAVKTTKQPKDRNKVAIEVSAGTLNLIQFILERVSQAKALDPLDDPIALVGQKVRFFTTTGFTGTGEIDQYIQSPEQWVVAYETTFTIEGKEKKVRSHVCVDRGEFQVVA